MGVAVMTAPRSAVDPALFATINSSVMVTESAGGVRVQGPGEFPQSIGLRAQAGRVGYLVDRLYRKARAHALPQGKRDVLFAPEVAHLAYQLADAVRKKIAEAALQPVDQAHVERLLGISRAECNRWTKDGRLSTSGFLTVSRTPQIRIRRATYPPAFLDHLAKHPEIIEGWRKEDRASRPVS